VEIRDPRSEIRVPSSEIRDPRSEIRDPRSEIRDPREVLVGVRESKVVVAVSGGLAAGDVADAGDGSALLTASARAEERRLPGRNPR